MADEQNRPMLSDDEQTIHALNIHGTFFERKCQNVVHQAKAWQIQETNYPVAFGGENSNLDIWAKRGEATLEHLVLPIECKKNNPDFIDWIFFRQPRHRPPFSTMQMIQTRYPLGGSGIWGGYRELQPLRHDLPIADEARETKGDYQRIKQQDRTRTSNAAITDAAKQITIATQALLQQVQSILDDISRTLSKSFPPVNQIFIFPTIVTTAKLYLCEFDDADVELSIGVIAPNKPKLVPYPYLVFDYPVPPALQLVPKAFNLSNTVDTLKQLARMPIFIVNSQAFPTFLERLCKPISHAQEGVSPWYEMHLEPEEFRKTKAQV